MRAIWLILSAFITIALEAWAWNRLIFHDGQAVWVELFMLYDNQGFSISILTLHLVSSVIATFGCVFVHMAYDDAKRRRFALFFTMIVLMPGFGLLGAYASVLHALLYPKKKKPILWKRVPVPELPYKPVMVDAHPTYGEGGLSSVIQSASDMNRRVNAVTAARQINDKLAIPLLQEALKDTEDDVRLFAYAVLDTKTTTIMERIGDLLADFEEKEGLVKARVCYAVAQNYWEIIFLGLASGNTLDFVVSEAEKFANQASDLGWPGSDIDFLIGRILLYQKKYAEAEKYFNASLQNGALISAILPFLAEIAYETRDFGGVRAMLKRLNIACEGNTPIPAIVKSWNIAL